MYVPLTVFSLKWVMTNNDAIDFMVERAFHPQQHFYKSEQEMSLKIKVIHIYYCNIPYLLLQTPNFNIYTQQKYLF